MSWLDNLTGIAFLFSDFTLEKPSGGGPFYFFPKRLHASTDDIYMKLRGMRPSEFLIFHEQIGCMIDVRYIYENRKSNAGTMIPVFMKAGGRPSRFGYTSEYADFREFKEEGWWTCDSWHAAENSFYGCKIRNKIFRETFDDLVLWQNGLPQEDGSFWIEYHDLYLKNHEVSKHLSLRRELISIRDGSFYLLAWRGPPDRPKINTFQGWSDLAEFLRYAPMNGKMSFRGYLKEKGLLCG